MPAQDGNQAIRRSGNGTYAAGNDADALNFTTNLNQIDENQRIVHVR